MCVAWLVLWGGMSHIAFGYPFQRVCDIFLGIVFSVASTKSRLELSDLLIGGIAKNRTFWGLATATVEKEAELSLLDKIFLVPSEVTQAHLNTELTCASLKGRS